MAARQEPIDVGLVAAIDQVEAFVDEMVAAARTHRTQHCKHRAAGCVGDGLLEYMSDQQRTPNGRRLMILLLCETLARLADHQPAPSTTVEGISP